MPLTGDVWFSTNGAARGQWLAPQDTMQWLDFSDDRRTFPTWEWFADGLTAHPSSRRRPPVQPNFHSNFRIFAE